MAFVPVSTARGHASRAAKERAVCTRRSWVGRTRPDHASLHERVALTEVRATSKRGVERKGKSQDQDGSLMLKRSQFKSEEAFIKVDFTSSLGHVGVPEDFGAQNSEEVVRVSTVVQNVRDDFHLRGRVSTVLNCACDRCLDEFPFQSRGEFELWLATREDLVPMIDGPDDTRADEAVEKFTDDILAVDLTPHVYDAIMLSVPIKKLCREDCPGLWDRVDPEPEFEVPVPIESTDSPQEQLRKLKEALERGKKKKGRF